MSTVVIPRRGIPVDDTEPLLYPVVLKKVGVGGVLDTRREIVASTMTAMISRGQSRCVCE